MRFLKVLLLFLPLTLTVNTALAGLGHQPPGRQVAGFGSTESYIASSYQTYTQGSSSEGDKTWFYVPDTLKNGSSAPVVVYLHGFAALYPFVYQSHIEHLLYQGNIVIFPQFQKSTLFGFFSESGIFSEMDQIIWAQRAVASVDVVLDELVDLAEEDAIYVYGHSLGGLIALAWQDQGGHDVQGILLSHPQVDSSAGMPPFVKAFVKVKDIPWRDFVGEIDAPVVILNGDEDTIAPVSQSIEVFDGLLTSPQSALYIAQRDRYGWPQISPNHGAPLDFIHGLPAHLKMFGVSGELDMLDWRYYFAGLDALMAGQVTEMDFDLGQWSDGTEVKSVEHF